MDMPPLIEIGSNPTWLFALFAVFLAIFHGWLIYWKPIGQVGWKRVDYIWLSVAAVGLVGQSAQVRQHWYSSAYDMYHYRIEGALSSLKMRADFSISNAICGMCVKTEYSPKNFDQIESEYQFACGEFKRITKEVLSPQGPRDVAFLDLLDVSPIQSKLTHPVLIETLENLANAHREFIGVLKEKSNAKYKTQTTTNEFVLIAFSPFLLMLALALRITKVTGEVRLSANRVRAGF